MDIIRYFLHFLFKLAVALFFASIVWWLIVALFPNVSIKSITSLLYVSGTKQEGDSWLPAPTSFKGLLGKPIIPTSKTNVYVSPGPYVYSNGGSPYGTAFNGNQGGANVAFVTYTTEGTEIINNNSINKQQNNIDSNGFSQKNLYIRNLSIYEGGHVYTGLSFIGDARSTMFQNGAFPVIITDSYGRTLSVVYGREIQQGVVPAGWTKFQVKIDAVLPDKMSCNMIFQQLLPQYSYTPNQQPVKVIIPILCN